MWQLFEKIF